MDLRKEEILESKALCLRAMSHPVRLCILECCKRAGECNVSHLIGKTGKPQSTISRHLAVLRSAGIVEARRSGLEVYYSVIDQDVSKIVDILIGELEEGED